LEFILKKYTINDGLDPIDLLQSATDHFQAAQYLFEKSPSFFDSAGYLIHMAVEQILKAWLLHKNGEFKATHKLNELFKCIGSGQLKLPDELSATLDLLDSYDYLRYPNRNQPVEIGDEDLPKIRALVSHLILSMPAELTIAASKIDPLVKGGRFLARKKIDQK
jgi:HEPN domain-containing protein